MNNIDNLYKTLLDEIADGVYFVDTEKRITYWNHAAESLTGFSSDEVLGRHCSDNILMHIDRQGRNVCKDRCPLALTLLDGEKRVCELFMHHSKGERIPVESSITAIRDDSGKIIGAVELFRDNTHSLKQSKQIKELKSAALTDPGTKIANRRFLEMKISTSFEEMKRYNIPFGILLIDLDNFKQVNDTFGHDTGDDILRAVARTLSANCRSTDLAGRWGGEEFLVVVTHVDKEELNAIADKMRLLIKHSFIEKDDMTVSVTATIGGCLAAKDDTAETLVKRADELLYSGKAWGKNRVVI
ncbi:sensor domain-containing diguanylate cyclase [Limisalsivibrio acetivorans]|uniref:sensor domain-containing diguanylate cyclase n=1 Tax=Limisalsivibrio acetivorans TaxID=1304888 RepID=UPI0003B4EC2C|nr:GGDEF domain-containing protein [Limisalsivibrio acetivorans]